MVTIESYRKSAIQLLIVRAEIFSFLCLLAACASPVVYQPNRETVQAIPLNMALQEATTIGGQAFGYMGIASPAQFSRFVLSKHGDEATAYYTMDGKSQSCTASTKYWLGNWGAASGEVHTQVGTSTMSNVPDSDYCVISHTFFTDCRFNYICWSSKKQAIQFVNVMSVIQTAAGPGFAQVVMSSKLLPANPVGGSVNGATPLTQTADVQQYAVQAREAVRSGQIDEAIGLYQKAVNANPDWAVGHYNLAELLADRHDYAAAVEQMNIYLILSPNAANKGSAEQQVVEWQSHAFQH